MTVDAYETTNKLVVTGDLQARSVVDGTCILANETHMLEKSPVSKPAAVIEFDLNES